MLPAPRFNLTKKNVNRSVEGTSVSFSEVNWTRKNYSRLMASSFIILVGARLLKMSRYWYFASFLPAAMVCYMDRKFVPYGELENFYSYVYERRKAESQFKSHDKEVEAELAQLDKDNFAKLKSELIRSNKTVYEVAQEVDELYLQAAIKSDSE